MATKGLSIPVFGKYALSAAGVAEYTNGRVCDHAVSYTVEYETSESNDFYADDQIQESAGGEFNTGTLTLETADLDQATSLYLLSVKEVTTTVGETTVTELVFDEDAKREPLGFGIIEMHQIDNVNRYKAVILPKVTPNFGSDTATTKGETIEWQTKELTFNVRRSDENTENFRHPWKREAWFDTSADALAYLKAVLGVIEEVATASVQSSTTSSKTTEEADA